MISVVIFSAVILSLAGLSFQVAKRSTRSTDQALVMSVLQSRLDRATTINYDSLATLPACDTTANGLARVYSCVTLTATGARTTDVRIIVTTNVPGGRPDTLTFTRGRMRAAVPLR
jgi:Tfp pilus assembly protein PilV